MSANSSISNDNDDDAANFTSIFDNKSLKDWDMAGNGKFVIIPEDKALQSEGGMGLLWYTKKEYDDFVLRLEWKVSKETDNSGVFVRFPDPDDDPSIAVKEGYEIQIDNNASEAIHQTGAIYDFAAPIKKIVSKPVGQWNTMEIHVINQSYNVIINEEKVTEFTGDRLTEGYIGLQAHDDKSKVSFRNIMIKEVKS
jgi:3-keto-disaccharide hydrolase